MIFHASAKLTHHKTMELQHLTPDSISLLTSLTQQTLKERLINSLNSMPISLLTNQESLELQTVRAMLYRLENSTTFEECHESDKIHVLIKELGKELLQKIVVFVIASFQNSLKIANGLTTFELVLIAEEFLNRHSFESISDLIMALRKAKDDGKEFYNKFSEGDFNAIMNKYFEEKAKWLENYHRDKPYQLTEPIKHLTQQVLDTPKTPTTTMPEESYTQKKHREKALKMANEYQPNNQLTEQQYLDLSKKIAIPEDSRFGVFPDEEEGKAKSA